MFSCCRVTPKGTKVTKKPKKTEDNLKGNTENESKQQGGDLLNTKDKKRPIIPTITIENGKTLDNPSATATSNNAEVFTNNELNGNIKQCVDEIEKKREELLAEMEPEMVAVQPSTKSEEQPTRTAENTNANVVNETDSNAVQKASTKPQQQQDSSNSITLSSNNNNSSKDDKTATTTTSNAIIGDAVIGSNTSINKINAMTTTTTTTTTTTSDSTNYFAEEEGLNNKSDKFNKTDSSEEITENKPKSCLSRHNSAHILIKKRVNISTHAEIIEPDPLMLALLHSASLGDDEDEVFSDSMPPPKRDSMCAPYIERLSDDDLIAESLAYSHGLPEWFNNERINDVGCLEPPVTPVGRDELELKRQRLYEDLLRAAHAAVEHSARFSSFAYNGSSAAPPPSLSKRAGGDYLQIFNKKRSFLFCFRWFDF